MTISIYGLRCPIIGQIRYIGKSIDPVRRFKAHLSKPETKNTYCSRWISGLQRLGKSPDLCILNVLDDADDWAAAEMAAIAEGFSAGWPLTNLTEGGEGASLTDAQKERKRVRMSDPDTRKKMSASAKSRWSDPVSRIAGIASLSTPEASANRKASAALRSTPEYRAMQSERSRLAWADPEKRSRIEGGITDEVRAAVSAASKRMFTDPAKKIAAIANLRSKESAATLAEVRRSSGYIEKQRKARSTPEYKLRSSESQKIAWQRRKAGG